MSNSELFPSFNAKTMSRANIVNSFVPSPNYGAAVGNHHSLIIGPRGSGKTTLLKMLEVDSLRMWAHQRADLWRSSQSHNGVYVPGDLVWATSMENIRSSRLDNEAGEVFSLAVFATSVMLALCSGMRAKVTTETNAVNARYQFRETSNRELQRAIRDVAEIWRIPGGAVTFNELRMQLHKRMLALQEETLLLSAGDRLDKARLLQKLPFASLPPVVTFESALGVFDEAIGDPSGTWALLLDEFELAPTCVRNIVIPQLRSASTKVLYKITLAPYTPDMNFPVLVTENNDFKRVQLWNAKRTDIDRFSNDLFDAWALKRFGLLSEKLDPNDYLPSDESSPEVSLVDDEENTLPERRRNRLAKEFRELAGKDSTFNDYLDRRQISIDVLISELQRSAVPNEIRKIAPTVFARNSGLKANGELTSKKSNSDLYCGWKSISAICEGNPRWLFALLSTLSAYSQNQASSVEAQPISKEIQGKAIQEFARTYVAMLKTLAREQPLLGLMSELDVFRVIDDIGTALRMRMYKEPFEPEPPLSFIVDSPTSETALKIALNHGAIVSADTAEAGDITFSTLNSRRFRLSYLLATEYSLILRLHRAIGLTQLLEGTVQKGANAKGTASSSWPLFE
jgi:hypothetical protein